MRFILATLVVLVLASSTEAGPFGRFGRGGCSSCQGGSCMAPTYSVVKRPTNASTCAPGCECQKGGECKCGANCPARPQPTASASGCENGSCRNWGWRRAFRGFGG